jgi:ribosomal peptide maturation radical SAM protein 1
MMKRNSEGKERSAERKIAVTSGVSAILVSMPFFSTRSPNLQIGLLAAIGRQHGFAVSTLHLNVEFAAGIGLELYEALGRYRSPEIGNWLFALDAFREDAVDREGRLLADNPKVLDSLKQFKLDAAALHRMRTELVPAYLQYAESIVDWSRYQVVGFTSTFQQNTASLALARRLKERFPHLITLFGGANFEDEMGRELVRACPWIDYAVDREGDEVFPAFLAAVADGRSPSALPGVVSRAGTLVAANGPFTKLDSLPVPHYDEYFQRVEKFAIYANLKPRLFFESSRGCWWGQKHHCTFCGLNSATMSFRQKSPQRVLSELAELTQRYDTSYFGGADNIMPVNFLTELVPALIAQEKRYDIFFEIKANLSRRQIKSLRDAGVCSLQPGIESLNSHVLRLMRKGISAAQNINLLRWATYYGVKIYWNFLWGFPGEEERNYQEQADLIPHLTHLPPPGNFGRIFLDRFSPFFFDRGRFPIKRLEPHPSLAYIYPSYIDRMKVTYLFEHEFEGELPEAAFGRIRGALRSWQGAWADDLRPSLTYRWSPGRLTIEDRRISDAPRLHNFEGPLADLYNALSERPLSVALLKQKLDLPSSNVEISKALDRFAADGLVMRDEDLFLALAVPEQSVDPPMRGQLTH